MYNTVRIAAFLICLYLIISCNNTPSRILGNEKLSKDSLIILSHTEKKIDSLMEVREVFLDYKRHSKYKEQFYKADSLFLKPYWGSTISRPSRNEQNPLIVNPYKNLLKTYTKISRLKGSYVLFAQGQEDLRYTLVYLGDTTLTTPDMMGWFVNYYKSTDFSNDKYVIVYKGAYIDSTTLEIKIIDKTNDIQIWKSTYEDHGNNRVSFDLMAPLNYSLKLPILVISNSIGLDTDYDGIDKLDLEKMFNK
jgi:hypothetical protein